MMLGKSTVAACALTLLAGAWAMAAQNLLPGAIQPGSIQIQLKTIATGLTSPVYGTFAPGDSSDLFVVDQIGKIDVIHNGVLQATPFLNITSVENALGLNPAYDERGLLGLAFSPGFSTP